MPQLDHLIVLPQIFWFIIIFSFFYFSTTYYFLPILLKSIKSKKYFLEQNDFLNSALLKQITERRKYLINKFLVNFLNIKSFIFNEVFNIKLNIKFEFLNQKYLKLINFLLVASIKSVSYCNVSLLNSLKFYPSLFNKIKN